MVTDEQVRLLRKKRMEGKNQETAAASADMSVRTARKWETGPLPSQSKEPRKWRTRQDPFEGVWESMLVPLLEADVHRTLEARAVLDELLERHPGKFHGGQLRTLQRRFRDWRATHGPNKEVFFPQEHVPGKRGAIDFTHASSLGVTIAGQSFPHLLFVFRLAFSGWTWAAVAFSETFEALADGLQGALWDLGGTVREVCTDNLSAATHELKRTRGRTFTKRWKSTLAHYDINGVRITPGKSNENGIVEKGHDILKSLLRQRLQIRGSSEFESRIAYDEFLRNTLDRLNARIAADVLAMERAHLNPLPNSAIVAYTTLSPRVRKWSTIRVAGHKVDVRLHTGIVEVFYRGQLVERLPRLRGDRRAHIDYRHVIWSLVKKPGAFAQYRFRDELFPSCVFRAAYGAFKTFRGERADVEYVRVLHLAASTMECEVERALQTLLDAGTPFDYAAVKALASPEESSVPEIEIGTPDLEQYDSLESVK